MLELLIDEADALGSRTPAGSFLGSTPTDEQLRAVCVGLLKSGSVDLSKRPVLGKFFDDAG